jgi:hypothetical protein
MKIKDYYLDFLNENENFFYVDNQSVGDVKDVSISKKDDYVKIDFETTYGKPASLVAKYSEFKKWYFNNVDKFKDVFQAFVAEYLNKSKEEEQEPVVNEIVDDEGNIMSSDDKPNNSTNSMIGSKNSWDLEKVYKSSIPKSIRYYAGDLGIGLITW